MSDIKNVTSVLLVREIEPCLPFWVDRLGFASLPKSPKETGSAFVILEQNDVKLMCQTVESARKDVSPLADSPLRGSFLFVEVDDFDAMEAALNGNEPVVPRRNTSTAQTSSSCANRRAMR